MEFVVLAFSYVDGLFLQEDMNLKANVTECMHRCMDVHDLW